MRSSFLTDFRVALFSMSLLLISVSSCSSNAEQKETDAASSEEISAKDIKTLSEATGYFLVENMKSLGLNIDIDMLVKGIRGADKGEKPPMTTTEYVKLMNRYQTNVFTERSGKNLEAANAFLKENKDKPGVVALHEGKLEYQIVKEGSGPAVTENDTPVVDYKGTLLDGTVFDSSEKHGKPMPIPLKQTIPGFKEGVVGMKQGEKRRIYIHPDLGYGVGGPIPPNSLLTFDVEVVEAHPTKEKPASPEEKKEEGDKPTDTRKNAQANESKSD